MGIDWIGRLSEGGAVEAEARYVLLVDAQQTALEPLIRTLLLPHSPVTEKLWQNGRWPTSSLRDAL